MNIIAKKLVGGGKTLSFLLLFVLATPIFAGSYTWIGGASGSFTEAGNWSPKPTGAFTSNDELSIAGPVSISLDAAAIAGKIVFTSNSAKISGNSTLTVTSIENAGVGEIIFACPVQFSGTYNVIQKGPVRFSNKATASYPDNALRTANANTNTLKLYGNFEFTGDWSVNNVGDYPWVVASGSTVRGGKLTGSQTDGHRILRVERGASAYFTTLELGTKKGGIDIDGYLEVSGDITMVADSTFHFGRDGNVGTVKAKCIKKTGGSYSIYNNIQNLIIGSGGLGLAHQDYSFQIQRNTVITAYESFEFLGKFRNASNSHDWGLSLGGRTLTVNVPEGLIVKCGIGISSSTGLIRKTGAGTLEMSDTFNGQSGYKKLYSAGTIIEEGKLRLVSKDQLGTGPVWIFGGGRLEVAQGITLSNVVSGDGTLYLENQAKLSIKDGFPMLVGSIVLADGASVIVEASGSFGDSATLLSGVASADYSRFTVPSGFSFKSGAFVKSTSAASTDYVWVGESGADWAEASNWRVGGATPSHAPMSTDTVRFENEEPLTVGGSGTLEIAKIVTVTGAKVTFSCPVKFQSTYLVENAAVAPYFEKGVTATRPDDALTSKNIASHTFSGKFTFTDDWTIPLQKEGRPFVLSAGSEISGKKLSAADYTNTKPDLRIDSNAVATFESVNVAGKLLFWLHGGNLKATGNITVGGTANGSDFGFFGGNCGLVEANGIYKNVDGNGNINVYAPRMVVGEGGFGMYRKDYSFVFYVDSTLVAKADTVIYQPISSDGPKDGDWGLDLNNRTFTVDTAGHKVVFDSWVKSNNGVIIKEGLGELVMQSRKKQHTGGTILNGGLTTVNLATSLGAGPVTVNDTATLVFGNSVHAFDYPILVNAGGTLANMATLACSATVELRAGSVLKPAQNAFLDVRGMLVLPAEGTVTVDLRGLDLVNGVPSKVITGIDNADLAKFAVLTADGISGDLSVSDGGLYYTATSGGISAGDLVWSPLGESVWSKNVVAWKNGNGEQVSFIDYANATIDTAANITIPENVLAASVTVSSDEDVTLSGEGKLGGAGSLLKSGEGVLTFNVKGGLESQPIVVSEGTLRLGDNLSTHALGSSADSSPIIVENGATLDINYNNTTNKYDSARLSLTHDKLIKIAGSGVDGNGAIVTTNSPCYLAFSDVVLTDDATIGGTVRSDFRHSTSYGSVRGTTRNTLTGPGKTLTVKNSAMLALVATTVDLGSILVPQGGELRIEEQSTWNLPGGIRLAGGKLSYYGGGANPGDVNVIAESGNSSISCESGNPRISGSVTIADGATLTHTGGNIDYDGPIYGTIKQSGGTVGINGSMNSGSIEVTGGKMYLNSGIPTSGWSMKNSLTDGSVFFSQNGIFSNTEIEANDLTFGYSADHPIDVTFNDSSLKISNLFLSWGGSPVSSKVSIGPGTVVNTSAKIAIGDNGTSKDREIKTVLSVDGGTLHHTGDDFFITHDGPNGEFILNSGEVTVDKATIKLRNRNQALNAGNRARFIQNGGVFNYLSGSGFRARYEDNNDYGQILFNGGIFNASSDWQIKYYIPLYFKKEAEDGWTLNQKAGTTTSWITALCGLGDVTLNVAPVEGDDEVSATATLVGNKEVQGAIGGKWTLGEGFSADLQGAASILGGLSVGKDASAKVNIATGRSAVFTARDFGNVPTNSGECITNRFNKGLGGTTRGTITHDETFLFTKYSEGDRPFSNLNYSSAYAVGQFYVSEDAAGEWSFRGKSDDWVILYIDGELVMIPEKGCAEVFATKNLTAGWHSFRHLSIDNSQAFGDAQTVGYKDGSGTMTAFANFSVKNLTMRPGADFADPTNPNTVRWSHFKGNSSSVTANTYKNDDFNWSFCCITNNLQMLKRYGKSDARLNDYAVNRFDGWFFVADEDAGKEWVFRSNYDDRCALWIDGVDTGLDGNQNSTHAYSKVMTKGWHNFRIQTADFTGNSGPWGGNGYPVSYQVAGGDKKSFSEENLSLSLCPDGYVQGDVTLASGAKLENTAEGTACVYGRILATGTGAVVDGGFKFEGGTLAFANVSKRTYDLTMALAFENSAEDFLANVDAITIDYTERPARGKVRICAAGGLDAESASERLSVTVNGEVFKGAYCTVENGELYANLSVGTRIIIR